jgi:hypothetical protein
MKQYTVTVTMSFEVSIVVDAESAEQAKDMAASRVEAAGLEDVLGCDELPDEIVDTLEIGNMEIADVAPVGGLRPATELLYPYVCVDRGVWAPVGFVRHVIPLPPGYTPCTELH